MALNNNNLLYTQEFSIYVFQMGILSLSRKRASVEINRTLESLTKSHSRPLICSLGSSHNVHRIVALSQARWPIPPNVSHKLAHLHLKSQKTYISQVGALIPHTSLRHTYISQIMSHRHLTLGGQSRISQDSTSYLTTIMAYCSLDGWQNNKSHKPCRASSSLIIYTRYLRGYS